jgi:hypothetical protein
MGGPHFDGWPKTIAGLIVFACIAYYRIQTAGEPRDDFPAWIFCWVLLGVYVFTILRMYFPKLR